MDPVGTDTPCRRPDGRGAGWRRGASASPARGGDVGNGWRVTQGLVVIVLNWCGYERTVACVDSVLASDLPTRVLLVDNASPDGSGDRLKERYPSLDVISSDRNRGYGGGNNLGIRRARELGAESVVLLNNDVVIEPDCLRLIAKMLCRHPRAALVAPKIVHADDGTIGAVGGEMRWRLAEARQIGHLEADRGQYDEVREVDFAPGTAVAVRMAAIDEVGVIPEDYFLYLEDVDWSLRFRKRGWKILVEPRARVAHRESSSAGKNSPLKGYYYVRNNLLFADRHAGSCLRTTSRALRGKLVRMVARELLSGRPSVAEAMIQGYLDYRAGATGASPRPLRMK
ncbi:MAG: glycosyltransferase [Gemmatimonas sp.]|nr:glycosyltransferase [Gemmatimonas sp.]